MDKVKINGRGQITIPKELRKMFGLTKGITVSITDDEKKIVVTPAYVCARCGKTLTDDRKDYRTCVGCPPKEIYIVY